MKRFSTQKNFCPHYLQCSGCEFHPKVTPLSWEVFLKNESIKKLRKKPELIKDVFFECRFKARLAVREYKGKVSIGLFKKNSHQIVDTRGCKIHHSSIEYGVDLIRAWAEKERIPPYRENEHDGLLRYIQVISQRETGKLQLVLVVNCEKNDPRATEIKEKAGNFFSEDECWHSIWLNFQPARTNTILGKEWLLCSGEKFLWQQFLGCEVAFHPGAFIQAHLPLFEKMIEKVADVASKARTVVELFAGVGVMGICIAKRGKKVTLVENNPLSYESFKETKNNEPSDVEYVLQDVNDYVKKHDLDEDLILVDPPRKGLGKEIVESFERSKANRLIYVSCNEKSFLQDVQTLTETGWSLVACDGYLFFPGANRYEILAIFQKKKKSG